MAEKKESRAKGKKQEATRAPKQNIRCRICRVVNGYLPDEDSCSFCGAKLFKGDVL